MKAICLLLCLASPVAAGGSEPDVPSMTTSGAFFALSVADIEASTRWYSEKLGLTVTMRVPKSDNSAVTVLEGGGLIVELVQHDEALPLTSVAPGAKGSLYIHGLFKAGVIVDHFDRTITTLRTRGVEIVLGPFPARESTRECHRQGQRRQPHPDFREVEWLHHPPG